MLRVDHVWNLFVFVLRFRHEEILFIGKEITLGGILWWNTMVEYYGGILWWNIMVENYSGILWWNTMVEYYGGILWWNNMVEYYGGIIWWNTPKKNMM